MKLSETAGIEVKNDKKGQQPNKEKSKSLGKVFI